MPRPAPSVASRWPILVLTMVLGLGPMVWPADAQPRPAAPAASASDPFQEALRKAEGDLRQMEGGDSRVSSGWSLSDMLGLAALLLAAGLMLYATRWTRGRLFRPVGGGEMRILDRMAVDKTTTLLLVRLRGRDYWLAVGPGGTARLAAWPAAGEEALPKKTAAPDGGGE